MNENESSEEENFVKKIRTLKEIAIDLTDIARSQSERFKKSETIFSGLISGLNNTVSNLSKLEYKRFGAWSYYFVSSLIFLIILIFIMISS